MKRRELLDRRFIQAGAQQRVGIAQAGMFVKLRRERRIGGHEFFQQAFGVFGLRMAGKLRHQPAQRGDRFRRVSGLHCGLSDAVEQIALRNRRGARRQRLIFGERVGGALQFHQRVGRQPLRVIADRTRRKHSTNLLKLR